MKTISTLLVFILIFCFRCYSANVKIIDAGSFYYTSDSSWYIIAADMGHTATINPVSTLNDTSFYATTDILIVSGGTISYTTLQRNNILGFIKRGKSVYLQAEYLMSLSANVAFEYLVEELDGDFDWVSNLSDDLDIDVAGGFATTYEAVDTLPYYWYGASGTGDCSVYPFLMNGTNEVGWIFTPVNSSYGRLICTTDQDWIGAGFDYEESQLLMRNIIDHLNDYDLGIYTRNAAHTVTDSVCSSALPYVWNGITVSDAGYYIYETTTGDGACDSIVTLEVTLLDYIHAVSDTICYGGSYTLGDSVFTTSGMHTVIFEAGSGCDSIVSLSLFVRPQNINVRYDTICAGATYDFGGLLLSASGIYTDTLPSGGCDSIAVLYLNVHPYPVSSLSETICTGESYDFNGVLLMESGTYADTITTAGCDSVVLLTLTVNEYISYSFSHNICAGDSYTFGGSILTEGGTYTDTVITSGCDSIVNLTLTVRDYLTYSFSENLCAGGSYVFNGTALAASGIYRDTFSTSGCDSIVTLYLTIREEMQDSVTVTTCSGAGYVWGDLLLSASGSYTQIFISEEGCDSTVHLELTIGDEITNSDSVSVCPAESYSWGDMVLSAPGIYTQVFTSSGNCDSTVTLTLNVYPEITTSVNALLCFGATYPWGDMLLTSSGTYTQVFTSQNGCDSLSVLSLTVKPKADTIRQSLTGCGYVVFEDNHYYESTILTDAFKDMDNCDSLFRIINIAVYAPGNDTMHVAICEGEIYTLNDIAYSLPGLYVDTLQTANGCDSVVTLFLSVNPLPDITIEQVDNPGGVCVNDSITFMASGAKEFFWFNSAAEIIGIGERPKIMLPGYQNQIVVTGVDEHGCRDSSSLSIVAQPCCDLVIPSAFSPNGDGLNDKFGPVTYGNPVDYQLQVYNKWGQRIFVSFKGEDHWDGTIEGKAAPLGTYFYQLTGKCVSGEKLDRKGDITLVR